MRNTLDNSYRPAMGWLRHATTPDSSRAEKAEATTEARAAVAQNHLAVPTFVLETDYLSRVVSGKRVVDDITIGIHKGEVLAVVGPSGSGKSSFLRLLNRLDEPTAGTVYLEGADYRQIAPRELRRRAGMVTQIPYLFPGTIADNLRFGPRQQGEELPEETIAFLLDQVGLADRADSDVGNLSGGEAQRVSLARAIANSPTVLLLDEPTSALDEEAKEEVEALILKVVRQNSLTCVIVSHDLAQAARIASRVMVVKAGRLEKIGSVKEVIDAAGNLH
ncbi:MAG TPA: phosphate ABC transporter ATP-binding protein [Candidatus Udaeobacter sp.]|nr:phosphate ABC transporter ATP-binding protein [Candidatus Udaeobacter sp.]